jgi:hypothetical protein
MFLRIDRLQVVDPRSAASLHHELLGGEFGEMPGLNNGPIDRRNLRRRTDRWFSKRPDRLMSLPAPGGGATAEQDPG